MGIENVDVPFEIVIKFRDFIEGLRIEDIRKRRVPEIKFKDFLFNKFLDVYGKLKDEWDFDNCKGGIEEYSKFLPHVYSLKDLKEKWAFWLYYKNYTVEEISKLLE